jgi:hypothetical protein
MTRRWAIAALLGALAAASCATSHRKEPAVHDGMPSTLKDCAVAVRLAEATIAQHGKDASQYVVLRAEYVSGKARDWAGAMIWRITFKPRQLMPTGPFEPIGAGEEIFIEADVTAGGAEVTGFGE